MPRLGGAEALREIRRLRPDTRIIVMSGHDWLQASTALSGSTGVGFIQKPFDRETLARTIEAELGRPLSGPIDDGN